MTRPNGLDHPRHRQVVGEQHRGIERDLVLLDVAADARDLSDTLDAFEPVAHGPIVERAQLAQVMAAGLVDQCVLEHPADTGGIGAERWNDILR